MTAPAALTPGARIARRFHLELAGWCNAFKQRDTAIKHYESALRVAPEDPLVLACIGFTLAQQDRKREALDVLRPRDRRKPDQRRAAFRSRRSCCRS